MSNKAKKPMTKKKKRIVIALSILAFLLVAVLCTGIGVLNWYCSVADYEIVSASEIIDDNTKIIAHRGFRGVAPENTLPAFEKAGENGFWGAECDIYRTKDGVWVVQHDVITYRMMDFTRSIEKVTYEELLEHNTNNGVNIDQYENLKICSFDEYLQACEKYGMHAVIELKGKNNTEHYDEIYSTLAKYDVDFTFISFHEENLVELRKLSADAPMFYLCDVIDEDAVAIAEKIGNCGIDFNAGKSKNFDNDAAPIKLAQEHNLTLGAWTIDELDLMKQCLDLGVDYITTDCITY